MSLVSAVTVDQAAVAVKAATDILLGDGPPGDVLLAVRTDGTLRAVTATPADQVLMSQLEELAGEVAAAHARRRGARAGAPAA